MRTIPDNAWSKSSRSSGANNCGEVAHGDAWTAVRDSKDKAGPILVFPHDEWQMFIKHCG
jgi:hypothetical protein